MRSPVVTLLNMKNLIPLAVLAAICATTTGCFVYERRTPARTVVVDAPVATRQTVITTLPTGYTTRVYRGNTYYYSRNVYYRTYPSGGYVVVPRPW